MNFARSLASSHGLWAETAADGPEAPPLAGEAVADVAVVGAGYTGLSAALTLAEGGARVAVLEARKPGWGGSGRNVGLVNAGLWVMPEVLAQRLGAERGARLLSVLGNAPAEVWARVGRHSIACEATRAGTLHCAPDARGAAALAKRGAQWHAVGAPVALLGADDAARRTGSASVRAALFDPRAGTLQPLAYVRGLARAAVAAGVRVHADSPVVDVLRAGAGWRLGTPRGCLRAARVVVATNAYTTHLWPELGAELVRMPFFNLATAPLPETLAATILPGAEGAWDTRAVLSAWRRDASGHFMIGSVGRLVGVEGAVHAAWAARAMARLYPALAGVRLGHGWWGEIAMTADALPRLHRLGPGLWSVGGYNGRGIGPGTVFGRLMGEMLLAGETPAAIAAIPLPVSAPAPMRGRTLKGAGLRWGAAAWHLGGGRGRGCCRGEGRRD